MYIVGFSGPPGSGKDSIAAEVQRQIEFWYKQMSVCRLSLAAPMRRIGLELLGLPNDDATYDRAKRDSQELFGGLTLRAFMIWLSESAIKLKFGSDFWARRLKIEAGGLWLDSHAIILVPDIGFISEISFFERTLSPTRVLTIQVSRDGCDFSIDSRSYVGGFTNYQLSNNDSLEQAGNKVISHMLELGWRLR